MQISKGSAIFIILISGTYIVNVMAIAVVAVAVSLLRQLAIYWYEYYYLHISPKNKKQCQRFAKVFFCLLRLVLESQNSRNKMRLCSSDHRHGFYLKKLMITIIIICVSGDIINSRRVLSFPSRQTYEKIDKIRKIKRGRRRRIRKSWIFIINLQLV